MGAVFALFSAWYFWIPKILGLTYKILTGKAHFWVLFIGVNLTFFPQHFLGLQGMPRRISDYPDAFAGWNLVSSLGSIVSVVATTIFLHILYEQLVYGKPVVRYSGSDSPFYMDTLQNLLKRTYDSIEWALNSPPKPHAFTSLPLQSKTSLYSLFTLICFAPVTLVGISERCDAPRPWGLNFQDSASPQMEALQELHDNIMFYLIIILFVVGWILLCIVKQHVFTQKPVSNKYVNHGTLIELIWTISPGLILIFIAFVSFKLLYLMDEVSDINMTFYIEGHQWYWSYEYPDFLNNDGEFIEYDSYLIPESDLVGGALRMLDVDERVIIPEITHARFIVSSGDVIHCYACPSLGIKADAYPGRLNQASALINREGTFYGQCSEICGILHSSMPIVIESVSLEKFLHFLWEK
jgi:heme/copper-type cytochrome/quinol oxidase subunit 2